MYRHNEIQVFEYARHMVEYGEADVAGVPNVDYQGAYASVRKCLRYIITST